MDTSITCKKEPQTESDYLLMITLNKDDVILYQGEKYLVINIVKRACTLDDNSHHDTLYVVSIPSGDVGFFQVDYTYDKCSHHFEKVPTERCLRCSNPVLKHGNLCSMCLNLVKDLCDD